MAKKEKRNRTELERDHSRDPKANPGNRAEDAEPHHALNNPVSRPDRTEWPDPYERREDPRDDEHATPAPPSTSEPHPPGSREELNPVKGDREGG